MFSSTPLEAARIMVVDDEPTNLKLIKRMLGRAGYENLVLVSDPREVVARYQEAPTDLVMLDINMPYLSGFEVMEALQALEDPLLPPIVILTAQHGRDVLLRALKAGARDFLGKPFDRAELLMRVRNLLEVHRAHRTVYTERDVLDEMVRARTEELNRTRLQVVRRLGMAAEFRDNETGGHILRMSEGSKILAESMGWSVDRCELMLHASPMHDVGKIGIPDAILLKPGKLTFEEFETMKTHSAIGASLLGGDDSDLLRMAQIIALNHHEKWNGRGYPNGLAGEAIPECARIVAVADVFDAVLSRRPYKEPWPTDRAIALIMDGAGEHFDPTVVEHFARCLPAMLEIQALHPDKA